MTDTEEKDPPGSKYFLIPQRVILAIMGFLSIVIAYTMRICLSVAITQMVVLRNKTKETHGESMCEPDIMDTEKPTGGDRTWSEGLQGFILSSFYIGYLITHLPGGLLADKFGGKWTLAISIFLSAICCILTPISVDLGDAYALIAIRIIMGLGQGTVFPALSSLLAQWVPITERGILGALVLGGGPIGTILGNSISGELLRHYKWPIVFYFFGVLSSIWFFAFILLCSSDPISNPFISVKEKAYLIREMGSIQRNHDLPPTPWLMIMTNIPMLVLISAQIGHDFGLFMMVTDLPKYMHDVMQFSISKNGLYSSLPYILMWIVSLLSGAVADWLISKNIMGITAVRKWMTGIAAFGPAIFMVAASYAGCNRLAVVILFTLCMGTMGPYFAGMKLTPLDIGPNYAGILMAITNGIGSITGIVAPTLAGFMTTNASMEEWRNVFWVTFAVLCITTIFFCIWGSGEIQAFNDPPPKKKKEEA